MSPTRPGVRGDALPATARPAPRASPTKRGVVVIPAPRSRKATSDASRARVHRPRELPGRTVGDFPEVRMPTSARGVPEGATQEGLLGLARACEPGMVGLPCRHGAPSSVGTNRAGHRTRSPPCRDRSRTRPPTTGAAPQRVSAIEEPAAEWRGRAERGRPVRRRAARDLA